MKDIIKISTVAFNAKWGDKEKKFKPDAGLYGSGCSRGKQSDCFSGDGFNRI